MTITAGNGSSPAGRASCAGIAPAGVGTFTMSLFTSILTPFLAPSARKLAQALSPVKTAFRCPDFAMIAS
jgi:hypothetical protein